MLSVNNALHEIEAIENLIGPYEFFSYDARKVLMTLRDLRNAINSMDKERIKQILEEVSKIEELAAPYRAYGFVEEALIHARKLLAELKEIVSQ